MRTNGITHIAFAVLAALGMASTAQAAGAPTVELTCSFRTPKPDVLGSAYLTLDLARGTALSNFRLASVATLGGESDFNTVESFRKVGNQFELTLKSVARAPYVIDGSITLHFAEADMHSMIAGSAISIPVTVVGTTGKTGKVFADRPCALSQQGMYTKDATEDSTVDPFVRNVNIQGDTSNTTDYPIWKKLETPNLKVFCVINSAQRSNGVNWPTREYCSFGYTILRASDGKTLYRHLIGSEAELIYRALPGHQMKFAAETVINPTDRNRISETSITCDSPNHCLILAKQGAVRR